MLKWSERLLGCRDKYIRWAVVNPVAARELLEIKDTEYAIWAISQKSILITKCKALMRRHSD